MDACLISSLAYASSISSLYVLSLYCWPNAKHRDEPYTIICRFVSVSITMLVSTVILNYISIDNNIWLWTQLGVSWPHNHSFWENSWHCLLKPMIHTSVLFMGPIVLSLTRTTHRCTHHLRFNLITIRNYIIAPITEEFIFRGVLSAILLSCWSTGWTVIISSILFGIAHSHHYISKSYTNRAFWRLSAMAALEQISYTTLFGMYASVLYLSSKFILTPILIHSYCNLMGLPDFDAIMSSRFIFILTLIGFILWILSSIYVFSSL